MGDNPRAVVRNLFIFGSAVGSASALLSWLADRELDPGWRWDILAASGPWELAFERVSAMYSGPRMTAGLAQDISDVTGVVTEADQFINEELRRDSLSQMDSSVTYPVDEHGLELHLARMQVSLDLRRDLVNRFPQSATAHYQLGSFLGMLGKNFGNRQLVQEGILECKIASGLQPDWDAPAVETGIILVNIGEAEAALQELEQAEHTLPRPTPHLRFVKGYILMKLERYWDALACVEGAVEERPDFAPAYDLAAHCAFQSDDKIKGLRYAKEARMRGLYNEHRAWKAGTYSTRPKRV